MLNNSPIYLPIWLLTCSLTVFCFSMPLSAKEQSASINSHVEAGGTYVTRLGDLPRDTNLSIQVETNGQIKILLLNHQDFKAFPIATKPLFSGSTTDQYKFALRIPESGNYYLLLDNRDGSDEREFTLTVIAEADTKHKTDKISSVQQQLKQLEEKLREIFIFDNLKFRVARCGTGNTYASHDTVLICAEIGPKLTKLIGDKNKAGDALLFAIMHEIGHVLLQQWEYPFYDNEEVVDEFATALLVMFNNGEKARTQAEVFSKLSPDKELEQKRDKNDRHPLSVQRARNIIHWLESPKLLKRWQKVFVPHMQSELLRLLQKNPQTWTDQPLIEKELAYRSKSR